MSDENTEWCPVCEGPMRNRESDSFAGRWLPIETMPNEGEFLAWDPVAGKADVCSVEFYLGIGLMLTSTQQDGEYGPLPDDFHAERATMWAPISPPKMA